MQIRKENDLQRLGICHRLFNFIMSSFIGRGLKRLTLGHIPQDENASNGVQEPLVSHGKPDGEERVSSKLKDDSDSAIQIHFKLTEEQDNWTPLNKAMEKRNEFTDSSGKKEIPLLNGNSFGTSKPQVHGKTELRIEAEGSTGQNISIPLTDSTDQEEKKKKAGNEFSSPNSSTDASKSKLTGLGLNINEISQTFIDKTKKRMSRNVSRMEPEESN